MDHHTQYGMETFRGPFLFLCAAMSQSGMPASIVGDCRISEQLAVSVPEMPMRACPHKRLDKDASGKGEKKKGGKKNE